MDFKICSLKHNKLKEAFEQRLLIWIFTIYRKKLGFHKNCRYLKSLSTSRISLDIRHNYCPLKITNLGGWPGICKGASDSRSLKEEKCFCKNICIDVHSKQHFHHFNSLCSCCYSHPQGQRSHKGSPGIWNGCCSVI